ncbi:MAG TPA: hypothetical protein VF604_12280 [Pyrinomonadaceae bacterium]|jgi:hypothetical protein
MKKLKILFLCCALILSSFDFIESKDRREIKIAPAAPTVPNEIPNIFRPIGNLFKRLLGIKRKPVYCPPPALVKNLMLDKTEVFSNCSADGKSCSDNTQAIEVLTEGYDAENDVLTYVYKVSGGEIIGTGTKVKWNLSGVKPGTYTITAGVDDGCGVCGKTETKEIKVIECPNCN